MDNKNFILSLVNCIIYFIETLHIQFWFIYNPLRNYKAPVLHKNKPILWPVVCHNLNLKQHWHHTHYTIANLDMLFIQTTNDLTSVQSSNNKLQQITCFEKVIGIHFTPSNAEQPVQVTELQEKEAEKRLNHAGNLFRKNLQLKDASWF